MKKKPGKVREEPEMRKNYDFSGGVRGKYAKSYAKGVSIVVLDRDADTVPPRRSAPTTPASEPED